MAIASFDKDIEVIQKLDDEPNDVQGLTPEELKQKFDQAAIWLKEYINTVLLPGITGTGSTGGGSGASNIGAGVDDFPGSDVQAILNAFNDALTDRYTRAETNSYVGEETNDLVKSVDVNLNTGVITVTKKDNTQQTFDTALEKVPATMALVEEDGGTYLVITNQDGSQTRTDVSRLIDTYTFQSSTELSFSVDGTGNNRTVTATIRPASIGLDLFKAEVTEALEGYNAESAANAQDAADSAGAAADSEDSAKASETAAAGSASAASQKASAAETSAASAAQSASAASASAQSAQSNASQALGAKGEAQAQAALAQSWAEGGTGVREGENTNNAKYWSDRAQDAAGGGVSSFNGRTGAVLPQSGDYTAQQVGAIPASQKGAAGGVAELDGSGKLTDAQKPGYTAAEVGALPISGGTMTGPLTLSGDPAEDLQAAPKQYVDKLGLPIVTTEGDGAAYTATVPGITALTAGASFIMIPHTVSTITSPTLNVNNLGAKNIKRGLSSLSSSNSVGYSSSWLVAGYPLLMVYDGTLWKVVNMTKPTAQDLNGTVSVSNGGTGYTSITDTTYTTARYRASSLNSSDTTPSSNGVIAWTYE